MRIKLTIDSATTQELRSFCVAYHQATKQLCWEPLSVQDSGVVVKTEGPECFGATTPMMPENVALTMSALFDDAIRAKRTEQLEAIFDAGLDASQKF